MEDTTASCDLRNGKRRRTGLETRHSGRSKTRSAGEKTGGKVCVERRLGKVIEQTLAFGRGIDVLEGMARDKREERSDKSVGGYLWSH